MRALDRKLLRDFWHLRGQSLAISLVIASGIATFIMSLATLDSLQRTRSRFYAEQRFADVFASLMRAPESVEAQLAEIADLRLVETRVVAPVHLEVAGFDEPITGRLLSLPDSGKPTLNGLHWIQGGPPDPRSDDEIVVSESFALAHRLTPGSSLTAILHGRRKHLTVTGVALSPEYIYLIPPGGTIPDDKTFGVLWMPRRALQSAYDLEGAFNDVTARLAHGGSEARALDALDTVLEQYGGLGAYGRDDQLSHRFLSEEFRQLEQMATLFPAIFLSVASFLLNVVITRLVATQREQIAALKAFGYSNIVIGIHFTKLVLVIVAVGLLAGTLAGRWLGLGLSAMYTKFYHFPYLDYEVAPLFIVAGAAVAITAGLLGTIHAVWRAAHLPPAEAMRPEPPASYRVSLVERLGLQRWLHQPTRMIIRHLERRPLKSSLSILGMSFACAILILGAFFGDAIEEMVNVQLRFAAQDDATAHLIEPTSRRALFELESLEEVDQAEPFRIVPVRLRAGHKEYRTAIEGLPIDSRLAHRLDQNHRPVPIPVDGLMLSEFLGDWLGVGVGDSVTVEALEGSRTVKRVPIARLVRDYIGVSATMNLPSLNRLMDEGDAISGVRLDARGSGSSSLYRQLEARPQIGGTSIRANIIRNFYDTMAEQMLTFSFFNTLLAMTIAFGVVYNSARIALSERGRELASLRVLGFTRGEIAYILLGELAILTALGILLGFGLGWLLTAFLIQNLQTDLFRIPFVIDISTFALATTVVIVSALISAALVRRKLNRLDLVAVLKTRE